MDSVNCRVTQNIFADIVTVAAAVHFEMTPQPNMIDNNIIWDVRNAEPGTPGQRGCAGSGISDNATSNLIIAQNLIGRCENAGVFAITRPDRNRPMADGNRVTNNIFFKCEVGITFLSRNNTADGNVFSGLPIAFQGFLEENTTSTYGPDAWRHITYKDLAGWQAIFGWGKTSMEADAHIDFNAATLRRKRCPARTFPTLT